ncbi:MAG: hypothetical protein V4482_00005 [Pseudomonadota bacterium]
MLTLLTSTVFAAYQCPPGSQVCVDTAKFLGTYVSEGKVDDRQKEINLRFIDTAGEAGSKDTLLLLLDPPAQQQTALLSRKVTTRDNPLPSQEALDSALLEATGKGNLEIVRLILSNEGIKNSQSGINLSYKKAVKSGKLDIAQAMLDNESIKPDANGADEVLTAVVQLKKTNVDKKKLIEFIYKASVKPTKAHTQRAYNEILRTPNLQELSDWFVSLAQSVGIELTVARESESDQDEENSNSSGSSDGATSHAENMSLSNEDRALIEACKHFNKVDVKNAIVGKKGQLTQNGFNRAIMEIITNTDPNYTHFSDFMGFCGKGNIKFTQETANSILAFAAETEQTNLLLQFARSTGFIDKMYTPEAMDKAILKIVEKANDQLLRAFTFDLASGYPKVTENGLIAAFKRAKQLNTRNTCPKGRNDGCMDLVISYLNTYATTLGVTLG